MSTELKPYDKYKRTPYDWLDVVPTHWKQLSVRSITELSSERNGERNDLELLSVYREYGVIRKASRNDNHNVESVDLCNYKFVDKGYLVLNKMKMWQGSLGVSKNRGIVSPAYIVCKLIGEFNFLYIHYLLRSPMFKTIYNRISYGVRIGQWDMRYDDFKNIKLFIPPKDEQDKIVCYLDSSLSKINTFIKTKKRLIEVLKEQRQAITNEAVSRGIDPNAKMKPSGIDWLGDIPDGWDTVRCKYLFREIDTRSTTGLETHLSMSQKLGLVPDEQLTERRLLSENYIGGKVCSKDDLVLNRLKAHLGVFALASQTGVISPDYTVLRPNEKIYPIFAETILKSQKCRRELRTRVRGIVEGFWRLYTDDFNNIVLPLPKYEEQVLIMEHLNQKSFSIDVTILRIEKEIELITEYRTRLISDVVTGKLDVRGITIDDVSEDSEELDDESLSDEDGDENVN